MSLLATKKKIMSTDIMDTLARKCQVNTYILQLLRYQMNKQQSQEYHLVRSSLGRAVWHQAVGNTATVILQEQQFECVSILILCYMLVVFTTVWLLFAQSVCIIAGVTIKINVSICTRNGHLKELLKLCLQSKVIINLLATKKIIGGCTSSSWPNRVVMVIISV